MISLEEPNSPTSVMETAAIETSLVQPAPVAVVTRTTKKRVRFSDSDDAATAATTVHVTVREYQLAPVECKTDLYWQKEELWQIHSDCRQYAAEYGHDNPVYVAAVNYLFDPPKKDMDDQATFTEAVQQDADNIQILSKSPCRGLEGRATTVIRAHRRWAVRAVLAMQAHHECRNSTSASDLQERDSLLRTRSLQTSRRSQAFSIKLAQGDAYEARRIANATASP